MNKAFIQQLLLLLSLNLLIKPFYLFGIERNIQNLLPDGNYGLYFALFNFTFLFHILTDLGLQYYNTTHLAGSQHLFQHHLSNIIVAKIMLSLLFSIVIAIGTYLLNYSPDIYPFVILIAFNQIISSFTLYFRSNLAALGRYTADSILSALDKSLLILFLGILLLNPEWKSEINLFTLILSQTAAWVITLTTAIFLNISLFQPLWIAPKWTTIVEYLKNSFPYAIIVFLMLAYTRVDAVMLERMSEKGVYQADIYAAAYRLLDAVNSIGLLFASLLLPMFSTLFNQNKDFHSLLKTSLNHLSWIALTICFAIIPFSSSIMQFLYPDISPNSYQTLNYLMISFVALSVGYIYGPLLTAGKVIFKMNLLYAVAVLINIGLNLKLIPYYGEKGAAMATAITQIFIALSQIIMANHYLNLKNQCGIWSKLAIFSCIVFLFSYTYLTFANNLVAYWIGLTILSVLTGIILGILRPSMFFSTFTIKN
jgi:O-antigen/teichoic acid export membrane protein